MRVAARLFLGQIYWAAGIWSRYLGQLVSISAATVWATR